MNEINKTFEEINELLKARSAELDRREQFDREISKEVQNILNKRNHDQGN